jgi:hypothetical protein
VFSLYSSGVRDVGVAGSNPVTPQGGQLEDITITVVSGNFVQLLDATGNVELTAVDDHAPGKITTSLRTMRSLPRPARKATSRLVDLISRIPALRGHFEATFERPANCYIGRAGADDEYVDSGDRLMPVLERMRGLLQSEFTKLVLWELERVEVQSGPV